MLEFDTQEKKRTFDFTVDGVLYQVPTLDSFPVDEVAEFVRDYKQESKADRDAADDKANSYVRAIFDEYAPGVCERLTMGQYTMLVQGYMRAASVDAGES